MKQVVKLRPYQVEAIEALNLVFERGCKSVLLVSPTGSGKTKMVSSFLAGKKVSAYSHRIEIREQIAKAFEVEGVKLQSNSSTSASNLTIDGASDWVFIDEAHHVQAKTFKRIFEENPNKRFVGATATPYRADGLPLRDFFDAVVFTNSAKELIEKGYLAGVTVLSSENKMSSTLKDGAKVTAQVANVADKIKRHLSGRGFLVFCRSIKQSLDVEKQLISEGVSVRSLTSKNTEAVRKKILEDFQNKKIQGVINCGILTEGVDLKNVGGIVLLKKTSSRALMQQMIGRGLRNDVDLIVLDMVENFSKHKQLFQENSEDFVDCFAKKSTSNYIRENLSNTITVFTKVEFDVSLKEIEKIEKGIIGWSNIIFN